MRVRLKKAFFKRTRIFPIMHVLGIKREIVEKYPWVPLNLYHAFNEAKTVAMNRMVNPRIVPLAWYRESWEEQEEIMGSDPWQYGMTVDNENQLTKLVATSFVSWFSLSTVIPYCHGSDPIISSCSSQDSRYHAKGTMRGLTIRFIATVFASLNA